MKATSKRSRLQFFPMSFGIAFLLCLTPSSANAQDDPNTITREVPEQTITFTTSNPYTKAPGKMTITFSGAFQVSRLPEDAQSGTSRLVGRQVGTFTFVPDDPSQPPVSGGFRFRLAGRTQPRSNEVHFAFSITGVAQDGSRLTFLQFERVLIKEDSVEVSFGETRAVGSMDN